MNDLLALARLRDYRARRESSWDRTGRNRDSVRVEHGHANCLSNDMCSVAYWYQLEPHRDFASMPTASKRAPRPD